MRDNRFKRKEGKEKENSRRENYYNWKKKREIAPQVKRGQSRQAEQAAGCNYAVYSMSRQEWIRTAAEGLAVILAYAYIFYESIWAMPLLFPLFYLHKKRKKKQFQKERMERLNQEFREVMVSLANALSAGYSLENAFKVAQKEYDLLHTESAGDMSRELHYFLNQLDMNLTMEEILNDFAARSRLPDAESFAQIVTIAKRSGGNLVKILHKTVDNITVKEQVREEITTMITAKKLEQNLMNYMPAAIIGYLKLSNPGYLAPLYGNLLGILVATAGIILTQIAGRLADRIMEIEV